MRLLCHDLTYKIRATSTTTTTTDRKCLWMNGWTSEKMNVSGDRLTSQTNQLKRSTLVQAEGTALNHIWLTMETHNWRRRLTRHYPKFSSINGICFEDRRNRELHGIQFRYNKRNTSINLRHLWSPETSRIVKLWRLTWRI